MQQESSGATEPENVRRGYSSRSLYPVTISADKAIHLISRVHFAGGGVENSANARYSSGHKAHLNLRPGVLHV
jgi:hypothetical protein